MYNDRIMKNSKLRNIASALTVLIYCLNLLMMSHNSLFSIFNQINAGPIFFFILLLLLASRLIEIPSFCWTAFFMCVYSVICTQINHGGIMSAFQQVYIFIYLLMLFNCKFSKRIFKTIIVVNCFVWIMWIFQVSLSKNYYLVWMNQGVGNTFNSNTVSELLVFTFITATNLSNILIRDKYTISFRKHIISKNPQRLFQFLMFLFTIIGVIRCDSRTSLLVLAIFFILDFIIPKKMWNKAGILLTTTLIIAGGILWPFIYVSLQNNYSIRNWVLKTTGKDFYTGRQWLYTVFFRTMGNNIKSWLFGYGQRTAINTSEYLTNIHNTYLGYILFFGIIGLALFIALLILIVKTVLDNLYDENRFICLECIFAIWTILITIYTETILIWPIFLMIPYFIIGFGTNESLQYEIVN